MLQLIARTVGVDMNVAKQKTDALIRKNVPFDLIIVTGKQIGRAHV